MCEPVLSSVKFMLNIGTPAVIGLFKWMAGLSLAYFLPLKDITHFLIIVLFADAFLSVTEQFVVRKKACGFRINCVLMIIPNWCSCLDGRRILITVGKILFYVGTLMLLFAFEKVAIPYIGEDIWITKAAFLLLAGAEVISCLKHIGGITNNAIFLKLAAMMGKKVKEKTDIDIEEEDNNG